MSKQYIIAGYHPELQPGEIFFANAYGDVQIQQYMDTFASARVGEVAYDRAWKRHTLGPDVKPIFVLRHEAIEYGFLILLLDGGYIPVDEESDKLMGNYYDLRTEIANLEALQNGVTLKKEPDYNKRKNILLALGSTITALYLLIWLFIFVIASAHAGEIIWVWPI